MNRLTDRNNEMPTPISEHAEYYARCINKLASYEDAEEQGRLVVLPCKVGDSVYTIKQHRFDCKHCVHGADARPKKYALAETMCDMPDGRHCPYYIKESIVEGFEYGRDSENVSLSAPGKWGWEGLDEFSGIDDKWYLTRAEAEAALGDDSGMIPHIVEFYKTAGETIPTSLRLVVDGKQVPYTRLSDRLGFDFSFCSGETENEAMDAARYIAQIMCDQSYDHGQEWRVESIEIVEQEERFNLGKTVRVLFRIKDSY